MLTVKAFPQWIWVWVFLATSLFCRTCCSQLMQEVVNPKTYNSRSGQYSLRVNPSDIRGCNEAQYQLTKDGVSVWSKQLPITLRDVGVTDNGVIGGYGYSNGLEGFSGKKGDKGRGDFHVLIVDAKGNMLCNDARKRQSSSYLHTPPDPKANGIVFDGGNDRLVVRIDDPDVNRARESWRVYKLSTGKLVNEFEPAKRMRNSQGLRLVIDAQPIDGTPLTLVQWWSYEGFGVGARFAALDSSGNWLANPYSAAFANDGSFVVTGLHLSEKTVTATVYEKDGTPVRTIDLPHEAQFPSLAFDGKNLVVGSLESLFYCDVDKGEFVKLTPSPVTGSHISLQPHLNSGELLIFDGSAAKLYRYKMPN